MIKSYRKKPVVIQAVRYTGKNADELKEFSQGEVKIGPNTKPHVDTLEGTMFVDVGDFVIRGVAGEFYPCKPDIFHATYEQTEQAPEALNVA